MPFGSCFLLVFFLVNFKNPRDGYLTRIILACMIGCMRSAMDTLNVLIRGCMFQAFRMAVYVCDPKKNKETLMRRNAYPWHCWEMCELSHAGLRAHSYLGVDTSKIGVLYVMHCSQESLNCFCISARKYDEQKKQPRHPPRLLACCPFFSWIIHGLIACLFLGCCGQIVQAP